MNSPFLHEQARRLAGEQSARPGIPHWGAGNRKAVRGLYRRVLGRSPEQDELALATRFITEQSGDAKSARATAARRSSRPGSN